MESLFRLLLSALSVYRILCDLSTAAPCSSSFHDSRHWYHPWMLMKGNIRAAHRTTCIEERC
jgi:hypothetical protein